MVRLAAESWVSLFFSYTTMLVSRLTTYPAGAVSAGAVSKPEALSPAASSAATGSASIRTSTKENKIAQNFFIGKISFIKLPISIANLKGK